MRKKLRSLLSVPLAILFLVLLSPSSAFAAHSPHVALHVTTQHPTQARPALRGNNLTYHGGPVMAGTQNVFTIFWQPTNNVSTNYHSLINRWFGDVGGSGLYHNNTQYTQTGGGNPSNSRLAGTFVDTRAYPETPLLDSDIQNEVSHAQSVNGWSSSVSNVFFVYLQRNEDLCFDSSLSQCASNVFCAYHSFFGSNTIYAAMPYAASFSCQAPNEGEPNHDDADLTINVSSHEQIESATDPLLNAWFDRNGNEIGDKCNFTFGPQTNNADIVINGHPYIVQEEWDNARRACAISGP